MSDVAITVRGANRQFHPAERGTVHAQVALEGADPGSVYAHVARKAAGVHANVTTMHDPANGAVTWWPTVDARTWSQRPWNKGGKQLPQVHYARTDVEVKFRRIDSEIIVQVEMTSTGSRLRQSELIEPTKQPFRIRLVNTSSRNDAQALAVNSLYAESEHGPIHLLQNFGVDLDLKVGTYSDDVGVVGTVMDFAQS